MKLFQSNKGLIEETPKEKREFYSKAILIALPIIAQNLINTAVNSADVVMLGYVSQEALSASSLANQVQFILTIIFYGLASGVSTLTAQYWGKGDTRTIEKVLAIALRFSLLVGFIFSIAAWFFPNQVMHIFTNDPTLIQEGVTYLRILAVSYLFMSFSSIYLNLMRSIERVMLSTGVYAISLCINISINATFIFGLFGAPKLGLVGVAIGTVIARFTEVVICVIDSMRFRTVRIRLKDLVTFEPVLVKDFLRISMPSTLNDTAWSVAFSMYSVILGHMGSDAVAANSIATVARNLGTVICFGMASATGIIIGKTIGENRLKHAQVYANRMLFLTSTAGILGGILILCSRPLLMMMGHELTDQARIYLQGMLLINAYYVWGQGVNTAWICGCFRAGGDAKYGMICDTIDMWCFAVPVGLFCAFVLKLPVLVVYFVLCLDEFVKMPFVIHHYRSFQWIRNITRDFPEQEQVAQKEIVS